MLMNDSSIFPNHFHFNSSSAPLSQKYPYIILRQFTESCRVAIVMFSMIFGSYLNQSYLQPGVSMAPQTQTLRCYQFKCSAMKHQDSLNLLDVINYLLTNVITNEIKISPTKHNLITFRHYYSYNTKYSHRSLCLNMLKKTKRNKMYILTYFMFELGR